MGQAASNPWERQFVNLGRVMQQLREESNVDTLVAAVVDYLRENFDYRLIWIAFYERHHHRLQGKGGVTPMGELKFLKERFALQPGDLLDQVMLQRVPAVVADLRQERRAGEWQKAAQKLEIQGTLVCPIHHQDQPYGVLLLGSHLWNPSPRSDEKARLSVLLGGLAVTLATQEQAWQQQQVKRPDQPLLELLQKLRSLSTLTLRLQEAIDKTHAFVMPTMTSIYWFEREHQYFWRREVNRQAGIGSRKPADNSAGITVQNAPGLYQMLLKDQLVVVVDAKAMTKNDIGPRVMEQFGADALMVAPIFAQSELQGFLCVEGNEPRLWSEEERLFVQGAAQLLSYAVPQEEMELAVSRLAADQALFAEVARAIYTETDYLNALNHSAEQICQRLRAERLWLLRFDRDLGTYPLVFQHHAKNRRPLPSVFAELPLVDFQMVEQSREAIAVDSIENDYKFLPWRPSLQDLEVRSLVLCSTALGRSLEGILVVGHESPRAWTASDRAVVQAVAQQLGMVVHQHELQRVTDERQKVTQTVHQGLMALHTAPGVEHLNTVATSLIANVLQVPLCLMITWLPGRPMGQIASVLTTRDEFKLNLQETALAVQDDVLVQWALQNESGVLPLNASDLPPGTKNWLNAPAIGSVLVTALRTAPEHEPTGVVVAADKVGRRWLERQLQSFALVVSQVAWSRRHWLLVEHLRHHRQELERLNWYKHRRIEDVYRTVGSGVQRLLEMDGRSGGSVGNLVIQGSLKQLQVSISPLTQVIRKEQWRLRPAYESATLAGILKRALERVDSLIKQRQIWTQVHNQANVMVGGDIAKMEMVIHEILLFACGRSQVGSRIDLWCRQLDDHFLELSITDYGEFDANLLRELHEGRSPDLLCPSSLDFPPGLHLQISQSLMNEAGGELTFYQLEDNRILSRLVLPLSQNAPS
jgi:GAF domain-containing protein